MSYLIAEAASRSGLSIDTLRYYERIRLIEPPARDAGGRRVYTDADLDWLGFLTRLRTTGMPLRRIRDYVALHHEGEASAGRRKRILVEQRAAVAERMAELRTCLELLDHKIGRYAEIERCAALGDDEEEMTA